VTFTLTRARSGLTGVATEATGLPLRAPLRAERSVYALAEPLLITLRASVSTVERLTGRARITERDLAGVVDTDLIGSTALDRTDLNLGAFFIFTADRE
jgi:hypothetical protein